MNQFAVGDIIAVPKGAHKDLGECLKHESAYIGVLTRFTDHGKCAYVHPLDGYIEYNSVRLADVTKAKRGRGPGWYRRKGSYTAGEPWCIDPGRDWEKMSVHLENARWED